MYVILQLLKMTSVSFYPKGGVVLKSDVYIMVWGKTGTMTKNNLWVLCATQSTETYPTNLVFRLAVDDTGASAVPYQTALNTAVVYTVDAGPSGGYTFTSKSGNFSLTTTIASGKELVTGAATPSPVYLSQNAFAPWTSPSSLLTGVGYTMATSASGSGVYWQFATSGPSDPVTSFIGVTPTTFYYGCKAGVSKQGTTPTDVFLQGWCSLSGKKTLCPNVPSISWVTQSDCVAGQDYKYCAVNQTCSTNCVSQTCPSGQSCQYQTAGQNADGVAGYACTTGETEPAPTSHKVWLIVGIVAGFIVLILFIIILKYVHNKKETPGIEPADIDDDLEGPGYDFGHDDDV